MHWAQLKVYGALLCQAEGLDEVELALVYLDITQMQETVLLERHSAEHLQAFFELQCGRFLDWARQELAHRTARDEALRTLAFPHAGFRAGQRALAEAVYRSAVAGRVLLAQAPTGIGKTVGTVYPLLKAWPAARLDKLFFLTSKTSGRAMALEALELLRSSRAGLPLRSLELVARDKACEHPELACHPDSCPLARGFYDRLPLARHAAVQAGSLDHACLRELAREHQVCPYYLSQEMVRWSDVVVGDVNYYFDTHALLHGMTQAHEWRVAVLADEAHNLVERGRRMYSAELSQASLRAARRTAPAALKRPLERLQRSWSALNRVHSAAYQVHEDIPAGVLSALQQATAAISAWMADHPTHVDAALQTFYFDALHFTQLADDFGAHSLCDQSHTPAPRSRQDSTLCLRNVVPASFLKPRFDAAHSSCLFSATLQPQDYHRQLLGLPENLACIEVESPFQPSQLQVRIARHISTRYAHRAASLPAMVELMAQQFSQSPGNYLAFFSSHEYLQQAAAAFTAHCPQVPVWAQSRGMREPEQAAFLARFTPDGVGIGFAVLGGSFSEGVDLPGRRLIGAFIATLGLPQVNPVNEQLRLRLDRLMGAGHAYAYLIPGLQKVVQAAGRVIRSHTDEGVVHLLDDRYQRTEVRRLLPGWWRLA